MPIAIRICKRCGKNFDAMFLVDKNIYCEECREEIELEKIEKERERQRELRKEKAFNEFLDSLDKILSDEQTDILSKMENNKDNMIVSDGSEVEGLLAKRTVTNKQNDERK